jgi:hypothetical protein
MTHDVRRIVHPVHDRPSAPGAAPTADIPYDVGDAAELIQAAAIGRVA